MFKTVTCMHLITKIWEFVQILIRITKVKNQYLNCFSVRSNKDKCIEHKSLLLLKSIICNHMQKLCYST